ncbi:hypothetical protein EYM_05440 [Ignicoccus islandicus DSM 13165]|uniref:Uncharacterized protein n=1 Tax=Ignicoccus islandicus DSM 13165 TaxID=940295 RepID=A0A0U3FA86_9CREN|nr:hypothetical protein [Ignicoccus islandicus]ALU12585.1 hypothetical protein EYM_05440 [Ignicoccus islandicus DSM 13165]
MRSLLVLVIASLLAEAFSSTVISGEVRALIPTGEQWIWVLNNSVVIASSPPNQLNGTWKVVSIEAPPGVNAYVLVKGPWICKIEALNLLGTEVKPIVISNASIPKIRCDTRYLWGNLRDLVGKGNYLVVFIPLSQDLISALGSFSSSVCLDVEYNAILENSTMVVNVTAKPLKPWIRICPPSKLVDVIVAWGEATQVDVYFNGRKVFHFPNSK